MAAFVEEMFFAVNRRSNAVELHVRLLPEADPRGLQEAIVDKPLYAPLLQMTPDQVSELLTTPAFYQHMSFHLAGCVQRFSSAGGAIVQAPFMFMLQQRRDELPLVTQVYMRVPTVPSLPMTSVGMGVGMGMSHPLSMNMNMNMPMGVPVSVSGVAPTYVYAQDYPAATYGYAYGTGNGAEFAYSQAMHHHQGYHPQQHAPHQAHAQGAYYRGRNNSGNASQHNG
jgi:hypothetical protein